jgi:hypothetical protein
MVQIAMSSIVTFYSYKGGVGRSMALANVAVLLARRGLRVLAVDWDLEAPGLERYFSYFQIDTANAGLLRMFIDVDNEPRLSYRDYLWTIDVEINNPIAFLASGREQDSEYSKSLANFNWGAFFKKGGGRFIEALREQWREDFDIVLIDSRTGLSDTGGICTIQLPDIVVAMFTANHQSLYGVRDVIRLAQRSRQTLAYDRMPLTVLPLPGRFGTRAEFKESQEWLQLFEEVLQEFYAGWLPTPIRPMQVLERLKVPQVDYFGFGEKLAVIEQSVNDPEGMGYIYNKVAAVLASDFADIESLVGTELFAKQTKVEDRRKERNPTLSGTADTYEYDLYVSYAYSSVVSIWINELVNSIAMWFEELTGNRLRVFLDVREIQLGDIFFDLNHRALTRSKLLIAVVTPQYFNSMYTLTEWLTFERRSKLSGTSLIIPLAIKGSRSNFPDWFNQNRYLEFQDFGYIHPRFKETPKHLDFQVKIKDLANSINKMLGQVPPFDSFWPVASPDEARELATRTPTNQFRHPSLRGERTKDD